MMVIGGLWTSSVEMIGFDNCSVPDLPEARHDHGSFLTSWGSLAVCGGWREGKPASSDCLVLNKTSRQWERGVLGGLLGDYVHGVVTLDIGTYMVHSRTSFFLPFGELEELPREEIELRVLALVGFGRGLSSTQNEMAKA